MSTNDLDLGWRWVTRRDAGAFQALVSRHAGMVYGTCRRVLGDATEAEDVAQECFELLARVPKWPEGSLGAWLHRVATNRSLNRLKSERRRHEREERYVRERSPQAESDWDDVYRYVDEAVSALPDKYRTPLIACFFESRSHATIAETLGIPRRTVSHRIGKGVELIRSSLRKRGVPVATASLAAMLGANLVEAAPASLTASLGRIALAGVQATEAASALPAAGGLLSKWLSMGGTLAMWQKVSVGLISIVLLALAGLWLSRSDTSGSAVPANANPAAPPVTRAIPAPALSPEQSTARAKSVLAAAFAPDAKPAPTEATASVQGTIIDDAGYPVPDALIRLEVGTDDLGFNLLAVYQTTTNANGEFALDNIAQFGHEKLYAHRDGYLQAKSPELALKPGAVRKDLRLALKKSRYLVSGWVIDANRRPIEAAEVCLRHYTMKEPSSGDMYSGAAKLSSTFTDSKGWFVIAVANNGDCDFSVSKTGFGSGYFKEIATGTEDATFVLTPGGTISGRVARKDGTAVPGAVLRAVGKAALGGQSENAMMADIHPPQVVTDADGVYRIDGLGAEFEYTVDVDDKSVEGFAAAPKAGIKVASGRTTPGVDFTLQGLGTVRVHGKVTDSASGAPTSPIRVRASVLKPGADFAGDTLAVAHTESDGSYDLTLQAARPIDLRIVWTYTDGANVFPKSNASGCAPAATPGETGVEVKVYRGLQPGSSETLDFTVTAPIAVPLRFVDPAGNPIEGIEVGVRQGSAVWGSYVSSGNDGCVVYRGLAPDTTFQIQAVVNEPERMTVGESEAFSGAPGQTLPELVVVCRYRGGVEGMLVDAAGQAVSNMEIGCTAVRDDGTVVTPVTTTTEEDGSFAIPHAFPYDSYQRFAVGYARDGKIEAGILQDIEISADAVLNLGALKCEPMLTVEEAVQAAQEMEEE